MNSIKFNQATKEIEIKGSVSFIESNFYIIENLLIGSLGVIETKESTKTESDDKPILLIEPVEPKVVEAIKVPDIIETPETELTTHQDMHEAPQELKVKRPPVRKYFNTHGKLIRSEDTSINKGQVSDPVMQMPQGISIASLKEKLGLSEQQIEVVIRDAEKRGRARRDLDGSYVWE
jgi:hypothetical protein